MSSRSRNWGVAWLVACADVFTATFWPGPLNGLTLLTILLVDAALLIGLIAVPKLVAANRQVTADLAEARRLSDERFAADLGVYRGIAAVRGER